MIRLLAFVVAFCSFGQCATALALAGPHSDLPWQPASSLVAMAIALGGFVLAGAIWRDRPTAARWLPWWGAGTILWVLALTLVIPSPSERRDAWSAFAIGTPIWAVVIGLATRWVRRRSAGATDAA